MAFAAGALVCFGLAAMGTGYGYEPYDRTAAAAASTGPASTSSAGKAARRKRQLLAQLGRTEPRGTYIVVDQTHNRLYLKRDGKVLREATCSAGSGMVLREGEKGRRWVFDTPRGFFRVRNKVRNPIWKKPDWAFIEEGKPIPKDPKERFERGTLGAYALYLGDGYLIHGTLYTRLLGRSVTHGCIRLGRDDLRAVYEAAPVGTPVFIY